MALQQIGLGTMGIDDPTTIRTAIECGYRHLDTARVYDNEAAVGEGVARAECAREDLFVATKLWIDDLGTDRVRAGLEASLDRLDLKSVDLAYVHRPRGDYDPEATLPALEACREDGLCANVGVSNFTLEQLDTAIEVLGDGVFAHQVEFHPLFYHEDLVAHAQANDYFVVAYSPLAGGEVFDLPELETVAQKHDVSPAAVSLAWLIGMENVVAIPKASSEAHLRANLEAATLELDAEDVERIESIDREVELFPE